MHLQFNLTFILKLRDAHWKVLGKGIIWLDLCSWKIALAVQLNGLEQEGTGGQEARREAFLSTAWG